jgi:hypothetical protein
MENRKIKVDPVWVLVLVRGRIQGKVKEPECGRKYYVPMYENVKMKPVENIPGMGGGG